MKNILMSVIKTVYRMKCHGLVLVFPLILCKVASYDLTTKRCQLKNKQIGRCIPKSICAIDAKINTNADPESPGCSSGSICCQMFAKIVTLDNGNSGSVSNGISAFALRAKINTNSELIACSKPYEGYMRRG
ncbi:hypothetical protein HUJ05_000846 [Dendroctonus ponderosae]|nr:hypothetical protein HUJ05_000846 [Dendroctonus ponderosae]